MLVNLKELSAAIDAAKKAVNAKHDTAGLSVIWLTPTEGALRVEAFNGNGFRLWRDVPAEGAQAGEAFGLDPALLQKTVKALSKKTEAGEIVFTENDEGGDPKAVIHAGKSERVLPAFTDKPVPHTPENEAETSDELQAEQLVRALGAVAPFRPEDEHRPALCGTLIYVFLGEASAVATDSHTLAVKGEPCGEGLLLPANLTDATAANAPKSGAVGFEAFAGVKDCRETVFVRFTWEGGGAEAFEIVENYPNWRNVVPVTDCQTIRASVADMAEAVKDIKPFANKSTELMRIEPHQDGVLISVEDIDLCTEASEVIGAERPDVFEPFGLAGFLTERCMKALKSEGAEAFAMEYRTPETGVVWRPDAEGTDFFVLQTPVMLTTYEPNY